MINNLHLCLDISRFPAPVGDVSKYGVASSCWLFNKIDIKKDSQQCFECQAAFFAPGLEGSCFRSQFRLAVWVYIMLESSVACVKVHVRSPSPFLKGFAPAWCFVFESKLCIYLGLFAASWNP